jgi:hypothetical protein
MLKLGTIVFLINRGEYHSSHGHWPPIGSLGVIHTESDQYNEYDVMFDNHPCPVCLPDESWVVPCAWVIPVEDDQIQNEIENEVELET